MDIIIKIDKYPFVKIFTLDNDTFIHHYLPTTDIQGNTTSLKIKTRRGINTSEGIRLRFTYK
jgi:hypothetical protein